MVKTALRGDFYLFGGGPVGPFMFGGLVGPLKPSGIFGNGLSVPILGVCRGATRKSATKATRIMISATISLRMKWCIARTIKLPFGNFIIRELGLIMTFIGLKNFLPPKIGKFDIGAPDRN